MRVMAEHEGAALMERVVDSVVSAVNVAVGEKAYAQTGLGARNWSCLFTLRSDGARS